MSRTTKLYATQLEDRTTPAKFTICALSPLSGDVGETAATFSGSLTKTSAVTVTAADATAAVKAAFSGSIQATLGGTTLTHTYSSSAGTTGDPFRIDVDGEQVLISLEDQAGQPGCDWDYNDLVLAMMVRQTGTEMVVHTSTHEWTYPNYGPGTAYVTVTVTRDKAGYEGLYHWNYHYQNVSFSDPPNNIPGTGMFVLWAPDNADVDNLESSVGWEGHVGLLMLQPEHIHWHAAPGEPLVLPGQSADFSFTTPVTGIGSESGSASDQEFAWSGGGQVKVPKTMIRSVTLWGMPGSASNPVGGIAGAPHAVILENNPKAGGGKRIFPEKNKPGVNSPVYDQVRVVVELSQAPAQNKTVNMYQFDVDDPSAAIPLIDWEYQVKDNRGQGANADGTWVGGYTLTVLAGKTTADSMRVVSSQPGDNYRFVASI